jgi:gamma-glutamylcyclotransferase (GGCT)/AIG2-like uncharacterized protein YtfP
MDQKLFSYGTLQLEPVQLKTFGRKLLGMPARLLGYKLSMIEITDESVVAISGERFHPIVSYTGNTVDSVDGTVFLITDQELHQADEYEVADYARKAVTLESGELAWVYLKK